MKYAIIAAGEGSRLAEEGVKLPKPLVMLQGEHLVERLMRIFHQHDAEEIAIIVNRLHPETQAFVEQLRREHPEWNITMEVQTDAQFCRLVAPSRRRAVLLDDGRYHLP